MAGTTTADRGREVRARLLAAAVELIAERGWAGVSTRMLAERAGVASGVVHYHFASVPALLSEAALGAVRGMLAEFGPALDGAGTPADAVGLMLGAMDGYDGTDPTSLLFAETYLAAARDGELRAELGGIVAGFRAHLAERLAAAGVDRPEATAAVLAAAVDGIMLHRPLAPGLSAADTVPVLRRLLVTTSKEGSS